MGTFQDNIGGIASTASTMGMAGGALGAASSFLGPVAIGLQVGNMLYGAWDAGKQARKQIKSLGKKSEKIQDQMASNASNLRSDLSNIDADFQDKQESFGEDMGERLEGSGQALGQVIQRGRGLLTGAQMNTKQDIIGDNARESRKAYEDLNTQRGGQYSQLVDPHMRNMQTNQQSLLDIASQQKQLRKQDSMWENLF